MKYFVLIVALVCCKPSTHEARALLAESCMCPCACDAPAPDAAIDAVPVDASAAIDLAAPWARTVITPSSSTLRGADGVAGDAQGCWVTAWEESGSVIRACLVAGDWITELVATGLLGAEDAKPGDLDGDGAIDVVTSIDAGNPAGRVVATFRGEPNITITIGASTGRGRVMQTAVADVEGDGDPDIFFGTRGTGAVVGWLENPGGMDARISALWTFHPVSAAGWVMSLVAAELDGDGRIDLVVSDRASYKDAAGVTRWDLYGARWMRQPADLGTGTWEPNAITRPAGSCSPYASPACLKTPGDEMMLSIGAGEVYDCTSTTSQLDSRVSVHRTADWLSWTHELVPPAANVGHCQHVLGADLDGDGDTDLAVSTWKGNAYPVPEPDASRSGVYWLRNDGPGVWSRGEVSGPTGGKFDNLAFDGCLVTSEQLDPAGGLGVVRFCPP